MFYADFKCEGNDSSPLLFRKAGISAHIIKIQLVCEEFTLFRMSKVTFSFLQ